MVYMLMLGIYIFGELDKFSWNLNSILTSPRSLRAVLFMLFFSHGIAALLSSCNTWF
jgi:hypothetical protein